MAFINQFLSANALMINGVLMLNVVTSHNEELEKFADGQLSADDLISLFNNREHTIVCNVIDTSGKSIMEFSIGDVLNAQPTENEDEYLLPLYGASEPVRAICYMVAPISFIRKSFAELSDAIADFEHQRTVDELREQFGSDEDPDHPREDWQAEAASGDTLLGYWSWVVSQYESEDE